MRSASVTCARVTLSHTKSDYPVLELRSVLFEHPERILFTDCDLGRTSLTGTNLRGVRFNNVTWNRIGRRIAVYDEVVAKARKRHEDRYATRLVYRDLKANLDDARDWEEAGEFYYAEMEVRRTIRRSAEDRLHLIRRYMSVYTLYWLAAGYGERPLWAFFFFVALMITLALLFQVTWFTLDSSVSFHPTWSAALGHSLRALTLQRDFFIQPISNWAFRLTLAAHLLGAMQLTVLAIALRRRFRR